MWLLIYSITVYTLALVCIVENGVKNILISDDDSTLPRCSHSEGLGIRQNELCKSLSPNEYTEP